MQGLGAQDAVCASPLLVGHADKVCPRWLRAAAAVAALAIAAAGCTVANQTPLGDAAGTAIAFESVEGPPAQVVGKFMRDLNQEAAARQIVVATRGDVVLYRIRGYLAASSDGERPGIVWAWDIYDAEQRRAFRLSGAEPTPGGRRKTGSSSAAFWSAADDAMLRRIAQASIAQLADFIAAARTPGPGPVAAASDAAAARTYALRAD
jgi:hypothetical protein